MVNRLKAWWRKRRRPRPRPPLSREQLQTIREYHNFFTYNGEKQTAVPFGNDGEFRPNERRRQDGTRKQGSYRRGYHTDL